MGRQLRIWAAPFIWAFLGGALLIGPLDLFHTCKEVQTYLIRRALTPQCAWPWYIPFQMGFAGVMLVIGWVIFKKQLSGRFMRRDSRYETETRILMPVSVIMVVVGYAMGFYFVDSPWHLNFYLLVWVASVFYLALGHRKIYILAFCLLGVAGILLSSILIDPAVGYYRFTQHDLLGRAPAWLLLVYGWIGVFIQEITRDLE